MTVLLSSDIPRALPIDHSIALQDLQQKITDTLLIVTDFVAVFAVAIMTSIVERIVSDGRRETAVFRALGALRGDIATIYTLYISYLIVCIVIISLTLGGSRLHF